MFLAYCRLQRKERQDTARLSVAWSPIRLRTASAGVASAKAAAAEASAHAAAAAPSAVQQRAEQHAGEERVQSAAAVVAIALVGFDDLDAPAFPADVDILAHQVAVNGPVTVARHDVERALATVRATLLALSEHPRHV